MMYNGQETYKVSQKDSPNFDRILEESRNNNAKGDWKYNVKGGAQSK